MLRTKLKIERDKKLHTKLNFQQKSPKGILRVIFNFLIAAALPPQLKKQYYSLGKKTSANIHLALPPPFTSIVLRLE